MKDRIFIYWYILLSGCVIFVHMSSAVIKQCQTVCLKKTSFVAVASLYSYKWHNTNWFIEVSGILRISLYSMSTVWPPCRPSVLAVKNWPSKRKRTMTAVNSYFIRSTAFITDRISEGGNAIASVRPSVRPSVRLFPIYLRNRLTADLEHLHVSRSWP